GEGGAASGGPVSGLSRYNANNVSGNLVENEEKARSDQENEVRKTRRERRFAQRSVLRTITTLDRVKKCGIVTNGNEGEGRIALRVVGGTAYWSGYCTCGSIWACPVCQAKIRNYRAAEYAAMVAAHLLEADADGNLTNTAWMVTLTARHRGKQPLEPLFDAVANGWRQLMGGTAWVGDKRYGTIGEREALGVRGWIRSLEVTWGSRNWFHPHLHVVILLRNETCEDLAKAIHRWDKTWRRWMKKHGYEPSQQQGVKWVKVTTPEEAGSYIAKTQEGKGIGNELTRSDLKTGKGETIAMLEVLEYFRQTGDMAAIPIWQEYEKGTFGRRAMTTSRGLRKDLLPEEDEEEKQDHEVAAMEAGGETILILPAESRKAMHAVPLLETKLLDAYEEGGFPALVNLMTAYHLTYELSHDVASAAKPS
ncbi:protein rep, partial [Streptomyces sp. NPDC059828]|uniref:protein rep n=1 Tax=Streptomyces sp. NPDC059828 TaxID=3346965 RepID=UPI003666C122